MDFATIDFDQARKMLPKMDDRLKANLAFYHGDHWQEGMAWVGPILSANHKLYAEIVAEIKREMVSRGVIAEIVSRHVAGVVGQEPAWTLTLRRALQPGEEPSLAERQLIDEAESALTSWWDSLQGISDENQQLVNIHTIIQEATAGLLLGGRATLRLLVPPGQLDSQGRVPRGALEESLRRIFLHQPGFDQAVRAIDQSTMQPIAVCAYMVGKTEYVELGYTEGDNTVIRLVTAGDETTYEPARLPLGGRLTMHELRRREVLITEQLRQQQKSLNLAVTMRQRNIVTAGFLEATYFNTQLPGEEKPDPTTGQLKFVPDRVYLGPGARNFFAGITTQDADGSEKIANPSVVYHEPAPVEVFNATEMAVYRAMLAEAHQLHALLSGDAASSGESRKQAMADFEESLLLTKPQVEAAVRWLLETALAMAAVFSGQPGRYAGLRVQANCHLRVGPLSEGEQKLVGELADKKLLSKETARTRLGIEDPDAEAARVASEQQDEQVLLSTALLNAQQQLDGGAASNGLETPASTGVTKGLNGAQISAAMNILAGINTGSIQQGTAVELLTALGIDRDKAEAMTSAGTIAAVK